MAGQRTRRVPVLCLCAAWSAREASVRRCVVNDNLTKPHDVRFPYRILQLQPSAFGSSAGNIARNEAGSLPSTYCVTGSAAGRLYRLR